MKKCARCQESLPIDNFARRGNGFQAYCRPCKSKIDKDLYANTSRKQSIRKTKNELTERNRRFVADYLADSQCIDCGESDIVVLEFDHVRGTKIAGVADMIRRNFSIKKIQDEIEKCEVRCCNCHRRKTAHETGSWILST